MHSVAEPVIEMEDVSVGSLRRPGSCVLEQVNWKVERAQFWVVAGYHASGKSDLLMTVAGLIAPVRGSYRFLGESLPISEDTRLAARLKVGLTFNGGGMLSRLTLGENVVLPLRYHDDLEEAKARERAAQLIEVSGLTPWIEEMPGRVGRQWHERAGLARALVMGPELLLLDDPVSGLDARHTTWWVNFLGELCRGSHAFHPRPMTIVVTADSLAPWDGVATHCAVLENRTLMTMGSLREPEVRGQARVREFLVHSRWAFDPSR